MDTRGWASVLGMARKNLADGYTMTLYHRKSNEFNGGAALTNSLLYEARCGHCCAALQHANAKVLNSNTTTDRVAARPNAEAHLEKRVMFQQAQHQAARNDRPVTWQDVARARQWALILHQNDLDHTWKPGAVSTRRPVVINMKRNGAEVCRMALLIVTDGQRRNILVAYAWRGADPCYRRRIMSIAPGRTRI